MQKSCFYTLASVKLPAIYTCEATWSCRSDQWSMLAECRSFNYTNERAYLFTMSSSHVITCSRGTCEEPIWLINLTDNFNQNPSPTRGVVSVAPSSQTLVLVWSLCVLYTVYIVRLPFIPFEVFKNTSARLMYIQYALYIVVIYIWIR